MKRKIIVLIIILSIFISGCTQNDDSNVLLDEGKILLEKHDYKDAMKVFSQILEDDANNTNVRSMYIQAMRMKKYEEYEKQGNYKKAIEQLELIEDLKEGSSSIKKEASDKKKELIKLDEEYEQKKGERKQNAKDVASKDRYRVQSAAQKEQEKLLQQQIEKEEQEKEEEHKEEEKPKPPEENKEPSTQPQSHDIVISQ